MVTTRGGATVRDAVNWEMSQGPSTIRDITVPRMGEAAWIQSRCYPAGILDSSCRSPTRTSRPAVLLASRRVAAQALEFWRLHGRLGA